MAQKSRLTRIYTRSGDDGSTGLVGGTRVPKSDLRIEAYGCVDELSSALGIARALNAERGEDAPGRGELETGLKQLQNELFHVGAELATPPQARAEGMTRIGAAEVQRLEQHMDQMNEVLGPLEEFILPGGGLLGSHLHLARTVCRRAERRVVALEAEEEVEVEARPYLNRLSDFLFVLARWAARLDGAPEHLWER